MSISTFCDPAFIRRFAVIILSLLIAPTPSRNVIKIGKRTTQCTGPD